MIPLHVDDWREVSEEGIGGYHCCYLLHFKSLRITIFIDVLSACAGRKLIMWYVRICIKSKIKP